MDQTSLQELGNAIKQLICLSKKMFLEKKKGKKTLSMLCLQRSEPKNVATLDEYAKMQAYQWIFSLVKF